MKTDQTGWRWDHVILLVLPCSSSNSNMSHVMRKPVFAICEQQRHRSACASAQSDQCLKVVRCLDSIIYILAISKFSRLWLASVAGQAGLCRTCSQTQDRFFLDGAHIWCRKVQMSHDMTKPTKWLCAQQRLRSAWASTQSDQSSLCTQWAAKDPSFLHANSEDSDQTGSTLTLLVLSCHGSNLSLTCRYCASL